MIQAEFSIQDVKKLHYERFNHPHPRVQIKMETLLLKSLKLQHKDICRIAGISKQTLCAYLKQYKEGGIDKLKELNFRKPESELTKHADSIEDFFRNNPPHSINEAIAKIEELTGLRRSPTQVRKFLRSIGMKFRKVGVVPSKADPDEQEKFKKK